MIYDESLLLIKKKERKKTRRQKKAGIIREGILQGRRSRISSNSKTVYFTGIDHHKLLKF